jgi:hypothetical protein
MPKKVKTNLTYLQIGQKVKEAWINVKAAKQIDRDALVNAMQLQPGPGSATQKSVIFDVITDQEIDANTRMVWITVPTPDTTGDWEAYANGLTQSELEDLGKAVIFGCGR